MQWSIDTGKYGAKGVEAKNLRAVLEEAMSHHGKTTPDAAERGVLSSINSGSAATDPAHIAAKAAEAKAAKEEVLAKLPSIQEQMEAGIVAAEHLAEHLGGRVTCTVSGHHLGDHVGGIFKRMAVFVDRAAPVDGE